MTARLPAGSGQIICSREGQIMYSRHAVDRHLDPDRWAGLPSARNRNRGRARRERVMTQDFSISVGTVGTGAWHSADGGETWQRVGKGLWNESRVFGLTVHPTTA